MANLCETLPPSRIIDTLDKFTDVLGDCDAFSWASPYVQYFAKLGSDGVVLADSLRRVTPHWLPHTFFTKLRDSGVLVDTDVYGIYYVKLAREVGLFGGVNDGTSKN